MHARTLVTAAVTTLLLGGSMVVSPSASTETGRALAQSDNRLDLNSASLAQLQSLPGVGVRTAERIVEYRERQGGFKKIEELMNVRGIGEKRFLELRELIVVTPPKTTKVSH